MFTSNISKILSICKIDTDKEKQNRTIFGFKMRKLSPLLITVSLTKN